MIYYPIQTLVDAGINDIMIVTGGRHSGDFLRLLANGKHFGLKHINYTYQEGEGGIADALALAEHFADGQKICVILGDNIIEGSIREAVDASAASRRRPHPAKEVQDAERFGVAEFAGDRIVGIEEKPQAEIELRGHRHLYVRRHGVRQDQDAGAFEARRAGDHRRQQCLYPRRQYDFSFLEGWWTDAGTFESLLRAANLVAQSKAKQQLSGHAEVTNWKERCEFDGGKKLDIHR